MHAEQLHIVLDVERGGRALPGRRLLCQSQLRLELRVRIARNDLHGRNSVLHHSLHQRQMRLPQHRRNVRERRAVLLEIVCLWQVRLHRQ